jgi:hypothetical protein
MENIQNSHSILESWDLLSEGSTISIFCNASKGFVVKRLARNFFGRMTVAIEPVDWKLGDSWLMQALVNIYTLVAMHVPPLAKLYRNLRMKQFATM